MRAMWSLGLRVGIFAAVGSSEQEVGIEHWASDQHWAAESAEAPQPIQETDSETHKTEPAEEDDVVASEDDVQPDYDDESAEMKADEAVRTNLQPERMKAMHAKIDANGDGKASLAEILDFHKTTRKAIVHKSINEQMQMMDSDSDGKVSLKEMLSQEFPEDGENNTKFSDDDKAGMKLVKDLEEAKFHAADANKDGFLDKVELPDATYPDTNDVVLELVAAHALKTKDTDGDGELSPKEFALEGDEHDEGHTEQMEDFQKLDKDANGKLSLKEIIVLESGAYHTVKAMEEVMEVADDDHDGHLSVDELDSHISELAGTEGASHFNEWSEHHEL